MPRHHTSPRWKRGQGGDFGIRVVDGDPKSKPLPDLPAHDPSPAAMASERSTNRFKAPSGQIERARQLLEQHGLGHLRPDKAWRPRSWRDRLASVPYPEGQLVDKLASEIYGANWREPSPEWRMVCEAHKEWSRRQARAALAFLRAFDGRGPE
jgi:hypothetical protein